MRRLVFHALYVAAAIWAANASLAYRPVGWSLAGYVPWLGAALAAMTFCFLVISALHLVPSDGLVHELVARADRWCRAFVVLFVWIGVALIVNARFDRSAAVVHRSEIVEVGPRRTSNAIPVVQSWVTIASRTLSRGHSLRVPMRGDDQRRFWRGERVVVTVRPGRLGVPWIVGFERDLEHYLRQILISNPSAKGPRAELVRFFLENGRVQDGIDEARRHQGAYPKDADFALYMGANLSIRGWLTESAYWLEHAVALDPSRFALSRLAWVLTRLGDPRRATEVAESASARYPDAWEFPLVTGYNALQAGDAQRASTAFARMRRLRPGLAEIDDVVDRVGSRAGP